MKKPLFVILLILLADQVLKVWIKTTMYLGQEHHIADWFILHFTENYGMAFGMELGGATGKILLSLFRLLFVSGILWYMVRLAKIKADPLFLYTLAFIVAGAVGNLIDSLFYGMIFSSSEMGIARMFPQEGGYASFLHGKVVDMFYFPLIEGHYPDWFPFWGGEDFLFFRPVFNLADSSISVGIGMWLLFQKRFSKISLRPHEHNSLIHSGNKEIEQGSTTQ